MSEKEMREALELIAVAAESSLCNVSWIATHARKALAALTDAEVKACWIATGFPYDFARAVIAAHESKRNGGAA